LRTQIRTRLFLPRSGFVQHGIQADVPSAPGLILALGRIGKVVHVLTALKPG